MNATCALLKASSLREQVMVDVSHANSSKQHRRQIEAAADVAAQVAAGDTRIIGVMIESHLEEGMPGTISCFNRSSRTKKVWIKLINSKML